MPQSSRMIVTLWAIFSHRWRSEFCPLVDALELSWSAIATTKNSISFFIEKCSRKELVPPKAFPGAQLYQWRRPKPSSSHVLIDEDWISIRVNSEETGRPCRALVRLLLQLHSLGLQLALQLADVCE